jgi:hypothetical protein
LVKRAGREANHSPPTIAEVKKTYIYNIRPGFTPVNYRI